MVHLEPDRTARAWRLGVASALIMSMPGIAAAAFIPPAGVSEYRLLFTTAGARDATSSNIADYNAFVAAQAAMAGDLPSAVWTAVASTASVDAVDNVDCGVTCNALPIYLMNGVKLADDIAAFFNAGSMALPVTPNVDQFGAGRSSNVWTGTLDGGGGVPGAELGVGVSALGLSTESNYFMLFSAASSSPSDLFPLFAISDAITAAPEPASGAALLAAGLLVTRVFRRRR